MSAGHMLIVSMFLANEVKNSEEWIAQVFLFPVIVSRGQYTISRLIRHGLNYVVSLALFFFFNYLLMF